MQDFFASVGFSDLSVMGAILFTLLRTSEAKPLKEKLTTLLWSSYDLIYSDSKPNLWLKNLAKEGNHFTQIRWRCLDILSRPLLSTWDLTLSDSNPLSLLVCV